MKSFLAKYMSLVLLGSAVVLVGTFKTALGDAKVPEELLK